MTKKLSVVAAGLLMTSSAALAESNTIKEAFANGKTSGDITVYTQAVDHDDDGKSAFTVGSIGINYETDSVNGFSAAVGVRGHHEFVEKEDEDYDAEFENDAIVNVAAIKYENKDFFVSVGRQEIDLEWLGDYNESVVAGITAIPDTTIILGYSDRQAAIDETESKDFAEITDDGAYVVDVKYTGFENFEINPYAYTAPDAADFYGLKVSFENDMFGAVAHYAASNEDSNEQGQEEDGDILNLELSANFFGLSAALGYIKTDSNGGVGSIAAYGDNIDPTEEIGDQIYATDARTVYATLGYEIAGVALSALYADVEYDNETGNERDAKEWYFGAEYNITEELSIAAMYIDYETDNDVDADKVTATVSYSF